MVFASIHTSLPSSQADGETSYWGYYRIPLGQQIGAPFLRFIFPEVEEDTQQVMTHIAIGENETGDGKIFHCLPCLPHIPLKVMQPGKAPHAVIAYPEDLPKDVLVIHQLAITGNLKPEMLDAKFFEYVNEHLQKSGIPILTVIRTASAKWRGKMSELPSFQHLMGNA